MDEITILAIIVAIAVAIIFFVIGTEADKKLVAKVEEKVTSAYAVATGPNKEVIKAVMDAKYGEGAYDNAVSALKVAMDALSDGDITIEETAEIFKSVKKLAIQILKASIEI